VLSSIYGTLPHKYAESLAYVDLVDILTAYKKYSKLTYLSSILGIRESSLSRYINGRLRPRMSRSLSLIKALTEVELVRSLVLNRLREDSIVEVLSDSTFTKLIALTILRRLTEVLQGSRLESVLASSEALLIASHISHRLRSNLLNMHAVRSSRRLKNLGNTAVILVLVDYEIERFLARVKSEGGRTDIRYVFSLVYSKEVSDLASMFPRAVVDYLVG